MKDERLYSIGELAGSAGVSRRTVRFYVQRGLLPAPLGLGRGQHYGGEHLRALLEIKQLQLRGVSLDEIREHRQGQGRGEGEEPGDSASERCLTCEPRTPRPEPGTGVRGWPEDRAGVYVRHHLLPGYELHVTTPGRPLDAAELAALGATLQRLLDDDEEEP
jgi:DNA-binding transcriptional MerR regulator